MKSYQRLVPGFGIICILIVAGCRSAENPTPRSAPLFDNLGSHHSPIATSSVLAQRYFNQGLILSYGFNHNEAGRAFREVTLIDSSCAMGYWGMALVLGPNINAPMDPENIPKAYDAIQKGVRLSQGASEKDQALIAALATRYSPDATTDRQLLDRNYAAAMREVSRRFPDDLDVATLFAESMMDLIPWSYWKEDGGAKEETVEIMKTLESVLSRNPDHPGAIHLYIHATEASQQPALAEAYAERLVTLVPGAGHLVHMPAHTFMRIGRYHDATVANQKADEADQAYVTQCKAQGIYPLAYHPHNNHFLSASAAMEGWSKEALRAARKTASQVDGGMMCTPGWGTLHHYVATPLYIMARFGMWKEILLEPKPDDRYVYPLGVWHYARGLSFARSGQADSAQIELQELLHISRDSALTAITIWDINSSAALIRIASEVLTGEIAATEKKYTVALRHLRNAVTLENGLNYDEPPTWYFPVRHALGAVLIEAGRPTEAETVFREDLERNPENGWALFGLYTSLSQQKRTDEATQVAERFRKAWVHADRELQSSRF
jgi:tetratricopeptide (TPR) repeat protein